MIFTLSTALPAVLLLQATAAAPQQKEPEQQRATGTAVTNQETAKLAAAEEITDKNHPEYVRCRSERVIGSLAKRKKTCMTNREWEIAARTGNRGARDIVESQQVGMNGQ
ncbi:hypothetical protein [Erythrobacter tepidarius]|uniref:hypothetical protein n=1 Tax=Erythrobacter tepidarius TaxID=60454 RepID=UPI000A35FA3C|nr:hypothetical protein [Erythrobacter tepidarius]